MRRVIVGIIAAALLALGAGSAIGDPGGVPNLGKSCDHISEQGLSHSNAHQGCP